MAFSNTLQMTLQSPRSAAFTIVKGYAYDVAVASPPAEYVALINDFIMGSTYDCIGIGLVGSG